VADEKINFPPELVSAQVTVNQAWAAVEQHRKKVDARLAAEAAKADAADEAGTAGEPPAPAPPQGRRTLPPWTAEDDAAHLELMARVLAASEHRAAALSEFIGRGDQGDRSHADVVQLLHDAARQAASG
jgi:hypothetical protein